MTVRIFQPIPPGISPFRLDRWLAKKTLEIITGRKLPDKEEEYLPGYILNSKEE